MPTGTGDLRFQVIHGCSSGSVKLRREQLLVEWIEKSDKTKQEHGMIEEICERKGEERSKCRRKEEGMKEKQQQLEKPPSR